MFMNWLCRFSCCKKLAHITLFDQPQNVTCQLVGTSLSLVNISQAKEIASSHLATCCFYHYFRMWRNKNINEKQNNSSLRHKLFSILRLIMGGLFSAPIDRIFPKFPSRILMVGLDNACKTTILYKLKLGDVVYHQTDHWFQCWDHGVQEYQLYCVGCRRAN